jgi:hypothetical protein
LKFLQNRINIVNTFGHGGRSMKEALDTRNLSPLSSPEPARSAMRPNLPQPPRVRVGRVGQQRAQMAGGNGFDNSSLDHLVDDFELRPASDLTLPPLRTRRQKSSLAVLLATHDLMAQG